MVEFERVKEDGGQSQSHLGYIHWPLDLAIEDVEMKIKRSVITIKWKRAKNAQHYCIKIFPDDRESEVIAVTRPLLEMPVAPQVTKYRFEIWSEGFNGKTGSRYSTKDLEIYTCIGDGVFVNTHYPLRKGHHVYEGVFKQGNESVKAAVKIVMRNEALREIRMLKEMGMWLDCGHPRSIIKLLQSGICGQLSTEWYIAMELCNSDTLYEVIKDEKLKVERRNVLRQIAEGLDYIHSKNILHGDLKPHNILFSQNMDQAKIADFGLSRQLQAFTDSENKAAGYTCSTGTQGWRSPEFVGIPFNSDHQYNLFADIFSLGLVFYYVLSWGKRIFEDEDELSRSVQDNLVPNVSDLKCQNVGIAGKLILTMLTYNPQFRPTTRDVLQNDFFFNSAVNI